MTPAPSSRTSTQAAGELKSPLTQVQSQAPAARVLAAGVSKVSGNVVEVLVVADQDVKNTTTRARR